MSYQVLNLAIRECEHDHNGSRTVARQGIFSRMWMSELVFNYLLMTFRYLEINQEQLLTNHYVGLLFAHSQLNGPIINL